MFAKQSTRQLYESLGPARFARRFYNAIGLADENGRRHRDSAGNPVLKDPVENGRTMPRIRTDTLSVRDLCESIVGEDWHRKMNPDAAHKVSLLEEQRPLLEAGTGPLQATDFIDINAFTIVVSGLYEVSLLEAWQNPAYISDELAPPM